MDYLTLALILIVIGVILLGAEILLPTGGLLVVGALLCFAAGVGTILYYGDEIEAAVAICSTCPVQEDCLQYALETNQESGVWGGYAEDDRRRLRKRWLAERRRRAV